jgi:hypothetical protein
MNQHELRQLAATREAAVEQQPATGPKEQPHLYLVMYVRRSGNLQPVREHLCAAGSLGAIDQGRLRDVLTRLRKQAARSGAVVPISEAQGALRGVAAVYAPQGRTGPKKPTTASAQVRTALEHAGCTRIGIDRQTHTLTVHFTFPDVAHPQAKRQLQQLATSTGWKLAVWQHPNQEALLNEVRAVVPEEVDLVGNPSVVAHKRTVKLTYRGDWDEAARAAARERIGTVTGWRLLLRQPGERG